MNYVVATSSVWNPNLGVELQDLTGHPFTLITTKEELTAKTLREINPSKIFLPHWSYILPAEIYEKFECVMFHMTDLPYGRGGSPLQNLILRGHTETVISAFRCEAGLDTGPVYLKKALSLAGTAQEIFERATQTVQEMIVELIQTQPSPVPQVGQPTVFKRRTPEEGNLALAQNLSQIYDFIRMLDAKGYPPAFLKSKNIKFDFSEAKFNGTEITATVKIYEE